MYILYIYIYEVYRVVFTAPLILHNPLAANAISAADFFKPDRFLTAAARKLKYIL